MQNGYVSNTAFHFDDNFAFEYDFAFADGATGDDSWGKSTALEIKDLSGKTAAIFKISPMANGSCCVGLQVLKAQEEGFEDTGGVWTSTITDRYKVKVMRECKPDGSVVYTVKVWKNETDLILDKIVERAEQYGWEKVAVPVSVLIYNSVIEGSFSNVTWSATAGGN